MFEKLRRLFSTPHFLDIFQIFMLTRYLKEIFISQPFGDLSNIFQTFVFSEHAIHTSTHHVRDIACTQYRASSRIPYINTKRSSLTQLNGSRRLKTPKADHSLSLCIRRGSAKSSNRKREPKESLSLSFSPALEFPSR